MEFILLPASGEMCLSMPGALENNLSSTSVIEESLSHLCSEGISLRPLRQKHDVGNPWIERECLRHPQTGKFDDTILWRQKVSCYVGESRRSKEPPGETGNIRTQFREGLIISLYNLHRNLEHI